MALIEGNVRLFGIVALSVLSGTPAAHAVCQSPKNICKHLDECLQRASEAGQKDADAIRTGIKARNGKMVSATAEACASDLGKKKEWNKWVRGCSEVEFVSIAKVEIELGKTVCNRYSQ